MASSDAEHIPVLLRETITLLAPRDGEIYVDGNLGLGGHAREVLDRSAPGGRLVGFDWDPAALRIAKERLAAYGSRVTLVDRGFAELPATLTQLGLDKVDGILLDLGLSSLQLGMEGRGFSFQRDEPLDMRMDPRGQLTAGELVNRATEEELADIFYYYGEERQARRIAGFVVEARKKEPITTTGQLAAIVERAVPKRFQPRRIHPATLVFQALRIVVNQELDQLGRILAEGPAALAPGGRFCVITFHSLEDRMVKNAFLSDIRLQVLTKKPVTAGADEVRANPRARSAKLRAAVKRG